jgi:hypothetical protein
MKSRILWLAIGFVVGVIVAEIIREVKQTHEEVREIDLTEAFV